MTIRFKSFAVALSALLLIIFSCQSHAQVLNWVKPIGSTGVDNAMSVATDLNGNVYTAGYFTGTVDFDPGPATVSLTCSVTSIFVSKHDSMGNLLWVDNIGGTGQCVAYGIAVDGSGNSYVTGYINGTADLDPGAGVYNVVSQGNQDIVNFKLTTVGTFVWGHRIGAVANQSGRAIAYDGGTNIYITGINRNGPDFNPQAPVVVVTAAGLDDAFVLKLDTAGIFGWAKNFNGATGNEIGSSIACDPAGDVIVCGTFQGTVDYDPNAGTTNLASTGGNDGFIVKLTSAGNLSWAKKIGSTLEESYYGVCCDASGNVISTGMFSQTVDFDPNAGTANLTAGGTNGDMFIQKLSSTGNYVWAGSAGGASTDWGTNIKVDAAGNMYSVGVFRGTVDFDPGAGTTNLVAGGLYDDPYILKLTSAGAFVWAKSFGSSTADDAVTSIATNATGSYLFVCGSYQTTADLDPNATVYNATSNGVQDLYLMRLGACMGPVSPTNTTSPANLNACYNSSATLSASGTGTLGWYSASTGGTHLGSGTSFTTPLLTASTTYYVQDSGCSASSRTAILVTVNPQINTSISSQTNVSCNGGANGSATILASGGTSPYTYAWSPSGGTAATTTGLTFGTYTCTITDANSCTKTQTVNLTQPSVITSSITSQTPISCNGGSNGSATVFVSGGTPSYTYNWTPSGGTAATTTGRTAGTYTCTITDANGCIQTQTVTLTQASVITSSVSGQTNISCNGGSNGNAIVTVSGGTPAYTYNWAPSGGTAVSASGLSVGTYTCTITDANSCIQTQTVTLTEPTAITSSISSQTNPLCNGGNDGTATILSSGGTSSHTYSWSPSGGTATTAVGLSATTYTCTITDQNSCTSTQTVSLTEPSAIAISVSSQTDPACNGSADGTATVLSSGGTGSFTYSWLPSGGTAASAIGLSAGTFTCIVTDANSCTSSQTINLTEPTPISATTIAQTNVTCNGGNDASVTIAASGGNGSYTYLWSPTGGTTPTEIGLIAATYTCTITDANSCTSTHTVTITEPAPLDLTTTVGGNTISANQAGATYQWIDCFNGNAPVVGETSQVFAPVINSDYAVIVTIGSCSDTSACASFTTGISSNQISTFNVFPNPTNGSVNIQLTNANGQLEVFNATGQLVSTTQITSTNLTIELPEAAGIYLIRLNTIGKTESVRVVKE